jgi:glycosyltransferase involved in cell wall biosynthesis
MKLVMINDCAFVGATLLKYMPKDMEKQHIRRSRSFWNKTFGIAIKILKSKGDVYHVNYLLQDCYIASKLGKKPLLGHAHGSDLREQIKKKKWSWIVKNNLRKCDKVIVAQPTILDKALEFNKTAEYFPIPFDPQIFFPKSIEKNHKQKRIFLASTHNFKIKGTDKLLEALASLKEPIKIKTISSGKNLKEAIQLARKLSLNIDFIPKVPHSKINELYWESDLVLGSSGIGQLDTVAIEAMACGRPVVHSIWKKFFPNCPLEELETVYETTEILNKLLFDKKDRELRIKKQLSYVESTHAAPLLSQKLFEIYTKLYYEQRRRK